MNTHDIDSRLDIKRNLPALSPSIPASFYSPVIEYAIAAIEADRMNREDFINDDRGQLRAEIVALKGTIADLEADRKARGEPVAYRWRKPIVNNNGETIWYTDWIYSGQKEFLAWWPHELLYTNPQQARGEPVGYFLNVNPGSGEKPRWEQVSDEYKNDHDVVALYTTPQPQQIPEGQQRALQEFFAALDKALALDKSGSAWTHRPKGTTGERMRAWAEVHRLRAILEAAPEVKE